MRKKPLSQLNINPVCRVGQRIASQKLEEHIETGNADEADYNHVKG